jgi:hypothetical protein
LKSEAEAAAKESACHRADQNQPPVGSSKPATLRQGFHNSFGLDFK